MQFVSGKVEAADSRVLKRSERAVQLEQAHKVRRGRATPACAQPVTALRRLRVHTHAPTRTPAHARALQEVVSKLNLQEEYKLQRIARPPSEE